MLLLLLVLLSSYGSRYISLDPIRYDRFSFSSWRVWLWLWLLFHLWPNEFIWFCIRSRLLGPESYLFLILSISYVISIGHSLALFPRLYLLASLLICNSFIPMVNDKLSIWISFSVLPLLFFLSLFTNGLWLGESAKFLFVHLKLFFCVTRIFMPTLEMELNSSE